MSDTEMFCDVVPANIQLKGASALRQVIINMMVMAATKLINDCTVDYDERTDGSSMVESADIIVVIDGVEVTGWFVIRTEFGSPYHGLICCYLAHMSDDTFVIVKVDDKGVVNAPEQAFIRTNWAILDNEDAWDVHKEFDRHTAPASS